MSTKISLETKKEFLSWFLDYHQLKRREAMWILNYLMTHETVLNKVHFVEAVRTTPRGMALSAIGTEEEPFRFFKEGSVFEDPEQGFHEIRLNWADQLYVELFFNDQWKSPEYVAVLEDNPYHRWNDSVSDEVKQEVDEALVKFDLERKKAELTPKINKALEEGNRALFDELSKEWNQLMVEFEKL